MNNRIYSFFLIVLGLNICTSHAQTSEDFSFVTKLGVDTVAVESISIGDRLITVNAIVRSPKLSQRTYKVGLSEDGRYNSYEYLSLDKDGKELSSDTKYPVDDGAILLPFHDYIHWSLDQMVRLVGDETVTAPMQAGRRAMDFKFEPTDEGGVTIVHPFRGTMAVLTDENGKAFGELSGRGSFEYPSSENPEITIDFGQPRKRGRQIFGNIVPYGKRWRTGANRATHFSTQKDITIGDLSVPAGEYTFFTILEENEGILFINKQTGQNGRQYDESQNLGQVTLDRSEVDGPAIEDFTIDIENGLLRLRWDDTSWEVGVGL